MADQGTQIYLQEDTLVAHDGNLTAAPLTPVSHGSHTYFNCPW